MQIVPDDIHRPTNDGLQEIDVPNVNSGVEERRPSAPKNYKYLHGGALAAIVGIVLLIVFTAGGKETAPYFEETDFAQFEKGRANVMAMAEMDNDMIGKRMRMIPPPDYSSSTGRFLGHITTDKPFYKPDENVFIETWVVDTLNKTARFQKPVDKTSFTRNK